MKRRLMPILMASMVAALAGCGSSDRSLSSLSISPSAPTVATGETRRLQATGTYSDQSTADLTASSSWTSSNPAAVQVFPGGILAAVGGGQAIVTATSSGISGRTTVLVTVSNGAAALNTAFAGTWSGSPVLTIGQFDPRTLAQAAVRVTVTGMKAFVDLCGDGKATSIVDFLGNENTGIWSGSVTCPAPTVMGCQAGATIEWQSGSIAIADSTTLAFSLNGWHAECGASQEAKRTFTSSNKQP